MKNRLSALGLSLTENTWLWKAVLVLVTLLIGWIIMKIVLRVVRKVLSGSALDASAHTLVLRVVKIVLGLLVVLLALAQLDLKLLGPLLTVLGSCGVAIALALKDSLGNVAGGLILVFTKPFLAGDEVEIAGNSGLVDRIDLFTTHLHSFDNRVIIIPNGVVTNSTVINATRQDLRRVDTIFRVDYGTDMDRVNVIVRELAQEGSMLLTEPAPFVAVTRQGGNGLTIESGIWCRTEDRFAAAAYIEENVRRRLEEEGFALPYPRMEIHMHGEGRMKEDKKTGQLSEE